MSSKTMNNGRMLHEIRADGRKWRWLVYRCAGKQRWIPPATDAQYRAVHGRLVAACRSQAVEKSLPELRRRAARDLDELLRPWASPKALAETPANLLHDLVHKQVAIEKRMRSGRDDRPPWRLGKMILIAGLAGTVGVAIAWTTDLTSSFASRGSPETWSGFTSKIVMIIQESSFTERFAVAVFVSWGMGTWLLSSVYKS